MKQINKQIIMSLAFMAFVFTSGSAYSVTSLQMAGGKATGMVIENGVARAARANDFVLIETRSGNSVTNAVPFTDRFAEATQSTSSAESSKVVLNTETITDTYDVDGVQYEIAFVVREDEAANAGAGAVVVQPTKAIVRLEDIAGSGSAPTTAYNRIVDLATRADSVAKAALRNTEFGQRGLDVMDYESASDSEADRRAYVIAQNLAPNMGQRVTSTAGTQTVSLVTEETFVEAEGNIAINAVSITSNTGNIATNTGNIATNTGNIATNTRNIATNRADIDTNTRDIKELKSGVAAAIALSSNLYLPTNKKTALGLSTGFYDGENAIALQINHRINNDVVLDFGVANSGGQSAFRAGASWAW